MLVDVVLGGFENGNDRLATGDLHPLLLNLRGVVDVTTILDLGVPEVLLGDVFLRDFLVSTSILSESEPEDDDDDDEEVLLLLVADIESPCS